MPHGRKIQTAFVIIFAIIFLFISNSELKAEVSSAKGQKIYVPAYSHIYSGDRERPVYLAVTLSIRNIDPGMPITIKRVDYLDSEGNLIKNFINQSTRLIKLHTLRFVIKESHKSGGSGAKFIVDWEAEKKVCPPIVESIMISTRGQQGISFVSRGKVIEEK